VLYRWHNAVSDKTVYSTVLKKLKSSGLVNGMEYLLKAVSTQTYLALVIGSLLHAGVLVELAVRMRGLEPHARVV
jgi:hypothetical protein